MSKEEMIKQVVLQFIDDGSKGRYQLMKEAGFDRGDEDIAENMNIFYRIYDSLYPVDAK